MAWYTGLADHVFYLNLAHRVDKRKHMEELFSRLGIVNARRFDGITRHTYLERLPPPEGLDIHFHENGSTTITFHDPHLSNRARKVWFSRGRFANVCSFYSLYKIIVEEKLSNVLVLEDDAEITDCFFDEIVKVKEELSQVDWDILYPLGTLKPQGRKLRHIAKFGKECKGTLEALFIKDNCIAEYILRLMDPYKPLLPCPMNKGLGASDRRFQRGRFAGYVYSTTKRLFYQKDECFEKDSDAEWQFKDGL